VTGSWRRVGWFVSFGSGFVCFSSGFAVFNGGLSFIIFMKLLTALVWIFLRAKVYGNFASFILGSLFTCLFGLFASLGFIRFIVAVGAMLSLIRFLFGIFGYLAFVYSDLTGVGFVTFSKFITLNLATFSFFIRLLTFYA